MATAALSEAVITRARGQAQRIGATAALRAEVRAGAATLDILESIIMPGLVGNPNLLSAWRATRRVVMRAGGGEEGPAVAPVQPPVQQIPLPAAS